MNTKIATLLVLLAWTVSVSAADDAQPGQVLVEEFVASLVSLEAGFEQSLLDPEGRVVDQNSGTLEILRPGRFRWTYTLPYEQWLLADGLNVWSYDVDLAQVTVKPQADALANTPALLLGGTSDALEQFSYDGEFEEQGVLWVNLRPNNTDSGFLRMQMGFRDGVLYRLVFDDNLQQKTLVSLADTRVNEPLDPERFVFSVPDDVDVVGTPAVAANTLP